MNLSPHYLLNKFMTSERDFYSAPQNIDIMLVKGQQFNTSSKLLLCEICIRPFEITDTDYL